MAMAAPKNKVASHWVALGEKRPGICISQGVRAAPKRNGTTIPAIETEAALRNRP